MIGVEVKDNESVDRAINRFKKLVSRSRILNEYRNRQEYTKPSKQRREALKKVSANKNGARAINIKGSYRINRVINSGA